MPKIQDGGSPTLVKVSAGVGWEHSALKDLGPDLITKVSLLEQGGPMAASKVPLVGDLLLVSHHPGVLAKQKSSRDPGL